VPGHDKVEGNRRADALAKRAQNEGGLHQQSTTAGTPLRNLQAIYRARIMARTNDVATPTVTTSTATQRAATRGRTIGRFTKRVDASYASGHTKHLYDALMAAQAAVLAQLRTGICGLNSYLRRINITDTQDCECGLPDTVPHFLSSCSRWIEERRTMREAHGEWWSNLPHAVGGRPAGASEEGWRPIRTVVLATVAFAKATGHLDPGGV